MNILVMNFNNVNNSNEKDIINFITDNENSKELKDNINKDIIDKSNKSDS